MAPTKTKRTSSRSRSNGGESQPRLHQDAHEVQPFDALREFPLGLDEDVRRAMGEGLNGVLADTRILHDLYKKYHWLMRGHTFYQLHLLLDAHAARQYELTDALAERVQTLGAVAVGDPRHVAELTEVPRPPDGAEEVPSMLSRILEAHETILVKSSALAERADEAGDPGTNDLLASEVIPANELQVWFVAEHLVPVAVVD